MSEKIDTSEELAIVVMKEYQHNPTVRGFYVYKEIWNPVKGEVLDTIMEPENPTNRYAVCVENNGNVVGYLTKGKNGRFSKTIFFFLRADKYGSCKVRIRKSKSINRGEGMEVECTLEFTGQRQIIDILKENLKINIHVVEISKNIFCYFTLSHLVFQLFDVNTPTGQEIRFKLKKVRVKRYLSYTA